MTERTERSGSDQQAGGTEPGHRAVDETTSVFVADGHGESSRHESGQPDRPNVPLGSAAPPWQRVQQASSGPPHGGPLHGSSGHSGTGWSDSGSDGASAGGGHGVPEHWSSHGLGDQPTVAQQRPAYPGGDGGPPNGTTVQNPFLAPKDQGGPPPPVSSDQPIPLGGPGAIPVGGPSGPAGPAGQQRPPTAHRPTARPSGPIRGRAPRAPRKASLQIRRFDPWSVLKLSLVLSVAMFLMWLVAVGVLYGVLDGMGVWDKLNGAYSDLASVNDESGGGEPLISAGRVFGVSAVVGVVNIVLFTAFATVSAFIYNVSADLAGGIEVTLSERD